MTSDKKSLQCYNKGCGQTYDPDDNAPESCVHHPGQPKFHDAYKGWTCCSKKSTDFSEFLSFPGCTKACHSNEKPVEPIKAKSPQPEMPVAELVEKRKAPEMVQRPIEDEPLQELNRTVSPSLKMALEKIKERTKEKEDNPDKVQTIPIGTSCKNATCKVEYKDSSSNSSSKCTYHAGVAIFHEGMKYWSCCQRKTSDFDNFLNQEGCTIGQHLWFKLTTENVICKHDFHQAGSNLAILTIYAKNSVPEKTTIKVNQIQLEVDVSFDGGEKTFQKSFDLFGVIKLEESKVEFFGTKVEIKLKKGDVMNWPRLEVQK